MKKTIFLILILNSSFVLSQAEEECLPKTALEEAEIEISFPCTRSKALHTDRDQLKDIMSPANSETVRRFCQTCKQPKLNSEKVNASDFHSENKKQFTRATLNELRKNLSATMIDLMSLRSTFNLGFKADDAISACSINELADSKCKNGKTLQDILHTTLQGEDSFQKIQKQLSYEIANTLSPPPYSENGLLKRSKLSCFKDDNELLHVQMKYYESLLTPELIHALQNSNIDLNRSIPDQLTNSNLSKSDQKIIKSMSKHPMIQALLKDGKRFRDSFKNVSLQEDTVEKLFSKSNSEVLSKNLVSQCQTAFSTVKETLCSKEYEEGNVLFNDYNSMKISIGPSLLEENKEENLYSFCMGIKNKNKNSLEFSSINKIMSNNISPILSTKDFDSFSKDSYSYSFSTPKDEICSKVDKDCDPKEMNCNMSKLLKASRVPDSPQSKLLASHDPNIDRILGSLIGSAPTVDTKTRTFLTEQGILPKADGTIVEAKDNQIRNPSTYSSSVKSFEEKTSPTPQPNNPTQVNKTAKTDYPESWKGADVNNSANDDSNAETSGSPKKKNKKSNFDSVSGDLDNNDEFKDKFTDRLNNLKNKKSLSKTKSSNDEQDEENDYISGEKKSNSNTVLNGSSNIQSGTGTVSTPLATPTQITSGAKSGHVATIDNTRVEQSSLNKAIIQAQNRSPAASDNVANTKISLSKTDSGLNNIEIKVPDESILSESTPALEKKIQSYLDDSDNSLQGAKTGEAYFVKLGNYEIKVAINDHGVYVAKCTKKCPNLSTEYLSFLSKYFTGIKTSGMSRVSLTNIINKERDKNIRNDSENKKSLE